MIGPDEARGGAGRFKRMRTRLFASSIVGLAALAAGQSGYRDTIERTAAMVADRQAQMLVQRQGLSLLNLTWEDTGRYQNSAVGPNISDMTIQVNVPARNPRGYETRLMPVIRFPNFTDRTADIRASDFTLLVGNERGRALQRVSLEDYLRHPAQFMSNPRSWPVRNPSLWHERDRHVLVSAQACFLPVPQAGKATFNPVLFNYQSGPGNPAVLAILATREGTSMTIIENSPEDGVAGWNWGQRLFHNQRGQRASLTGERLSDFRGGGGYDPNVRDAALNMVLLIQVPLRHVERRSPSFGGGGGMPPAVVMEGRSGSDVENAVIGHGPLVGPFTEVNGLAIERDPRFPIRVTVQYYKATSNGVISPTDVAAIRRDLDRVYADGEYVGSLVTGGGAGRPTEYWGRKVQPAGWWNDFWRRYEADTGVRRDIAIQRLRQLLGNDYERTPVSVLWLRDTLRDLPVATPTLTRLAPGRRGF